MTLAEPLQERYAELVCGDDPRRAEVLYALDRTHAILAPPSLRRAIECLPYEQRAARADQEDDARTESMPEADAQWRRMTAHMPIRPSLSRMGVLAVAAVLLMAVVLRVTAHGPMPYVPATVMNTETATTASPQGPAAGVYWQPTSISRPRTATPTTSPVSVPVTTDKVGLTLGSRGLAPTDGMTAREEATNSRDTASPGDQAIARTQDVRYASGIAARQSLGASQITAITMQPPDINVQGLQVTVCSARCKPWLKRQNSA